MQFRRNENRVIENRETPVCGEYEVIVVGGGPAGIGASLAAARNGMRTLLIESNGFLGGTMTAASVSMMMYGERICGRNNDIGKEIEAGIMKNPNGRGGWRNILVDCEALKLLLDRMMEESGVELLYHTSCVDTLVEGTAVKGVMVENKSGRGAYLAKVVIDCTGDGDVAARAGAAFELGRNSDGLMQPMTMMFKLGHIDFWQTRDDELYGMISEASARTGIPFTANFVHPYILMLPGGDKAVCQMTHIRRKSAVDARDLTAAEIEGRKLVDEAYRFFAGAMPEFAGATLEQTGPRIGIRESRRIIGEYYLTAEDLLAGRQFEDGVVNVGCRMDIHEPDGLKMVCTDVKPYLIPYRCLVPKGIDNLLVAGRCISGSHEAMASYRMGGFCLAMGEVAGCAASFCLKNGTSVRNCNVAQLLEELKK